MKVFKPLKKMILYLILAILLLVIQAICELNLPSYTSNIINIGIGNKGIESTFPTVLREQEMSKILVNVNEEDEKMILNNYNLISLTSISKKEYLVYKNKYPIIDNENIYLYNNKEDISNVMGDAIFNYLNQDKKIDMSLKNASILNYIENEYKIVGVDTAKIQSNYIFKTGLIMVLITLLCMVASIGVSYLSSRIASKYAKELRSNVFSKILTFSTVDMKKFGTSSLITRTTNDINRVQMLIIMFLRIVVYAPIMGVGAILKVLNSNASLTWIIGLGIVCIVSLMLTLLFIALPKFEVVQKLIDKLNLTTREIVTGIPVIRAFSNQRYEEKRFDKVNRDLEKTNLFVERLMSLINPMISLVMNGVTLLILWEGAKKIDIGVINFGDVFALIQYAMQIIASFIMLSMVSIMIPRAMVSIKRISEILNYNVSIKDSDDAKDIKEVEGLIEFKNVSFKYPNAKEEVLSNINFTAEVGKTTAIIGSTGSGKSTLVNLLPRLYDVTSGEIKLDGVDIKNIKLHDLRNNIGYIAQKGVLFSGTIKSNIKYGNSSISDKQMIFASNVALVDEFINSKEGGYNYKIAQGGTNVSGGQKQRLSIARAIAKKPKVYIFDDSFSALDFKTDAKLRKNIKEKLGNVTTLIVAQRISTIMHADKIVVLENGKVVGIGTHKELMKKCKVYKEIATSQLSKEELA
ncbi:aBC superfamily ATP binding cassette transporter [Clostridium sp. CAG:762]|nr:aBC superfamily ATP binding cassette transporter [Clostridium sp. CAG:762]